MTALVRASWATWAIRGLSIVLCLLAACATLTAKPEELRRFTVAVMKTARLFQSNRQSWVDALSRHRPDLSRGDLEFLWDQFTTSWGVNGFLNLIELQKESDFAYQTTPDLASLARIAPADWIDTRFVDATLKDLGVYPGVDPPERPIALEKKGDLT